ncbi:MAG: hypothetical protein JNL46_14270 [Sphingosinicella sp.]|nr:hypothetical protein [Sphingosinicella sp.]
MQTSSASAIDPVADIGQLATIDPMRRILAWTEADLIGLAEAWGLQSILTEVDEEGSVTRELGFDAGGKLIHRHPGEPALTENGVFDLVKVGPFSRTEMEPEEFDRLWVA